MEENRKSLIQLFVPICLEILLLMLTGIVDTLMLSSVSDQAVGAVGTANTYIGMFIMTFSIISSGMMAVMTQYIGAKKPGIAYQAKQIGIIFNGILGVILGIILFLGSDIILDVVGIAASLHIPAKVYLQIVGGACFLNAIIPIYSGYLRAFGHLKQPLIATIAGNVLNLILNAVFLFVFDMGVAGVAIATVISRVINLLIVMISSQMLVKAKQDPNRLPNRIVLGQIVQIGFPSAMESVFYYAALTAIMSFLNQMDSDGLNVTARSYTSQITNFSYCIGAALAQANAIMTGWRVGAKEYDLCDKATKKVAIIGILIATLVETVFALSAPIIMPFFSTDPVMIDLVQKLLFIDIILEIGRVTNIVFVNALKVSGDAVFPVIMASVFTFLCGVGGTYLFGIHLELMVVGAYIGLTLDECVRAIAMFIRWQTGIWKTKRIV